MKAALILALLSALPTTGWAQEWLGESGIGVVVRDGSGQPIPGAAIVLVPEFGPAGEAPPFVFTDAGGRIEVFNLAEGEWAVEVRAGGYMIFNGYLRLESGKPPELGFTSRQRTGTFWEPLEVSFFEAGVERPVMVAATKEAREQDKDRRKRADALAKQDAKAAKRAERRAEKRRAKPSQGAELAVLTPAQEEPESLPEASAPTVEPAVTPEPPVVAEATAPEAVAEVESTPAEPVRAAAPVSRPPPASPAPPVREAPVAPAVTPEPPVVAEATAPEAVAEVESTPAEPVRATAPVSRPPPAPPAPPVREAPVAPAAEPVPPEPAPEPRVDSEPVRSIEAPATAEPLPAVEEEPPAPAETTQPTRRSQPEPVAAPAVAAPTTPPAAEKSKAPPLFPPVQEPEPVQVAEVAAPPDLPRDDRPRSEPPAEPVVPSLQAHPVLFRGGACPECKPGEWALVVERVAAPSQGAAGECGSGRDDRVSRLIADGLTPQAAAVSAFAGPAADMWGSELPEEVWSAVAGSPASRLRDEEGACQDLVGVLPEGARFIGFRFEVETSTGRGDCFGEQPCPIGRARWTNNPRIERTGGVTVVHTSFLNEAAEEERRARMTLYFRPLRGWEPPAGLGTQSAPNRR
jgi:hypothetical protein